MRVLFDQGTPIPLRNLLDSHQIETAYERGWSQLTNGVLLAAEERESFEVFVTTDQNIVNQQNINGLPFAVVVLSSTSWPRIQIASDTIRLTIDAAPPGTITEVNIL